MGKNSGREVRELDKFWQWFRAESLRLFRRWGNVHAMRKTKEGGAPGEWHLKASCSEAESDCRRLYISAAPKLGCTGVTDEIKFQFMMDHLFGDHIIRKTPQQRRDVERFGIVTHSDGTKEAFRGRQRVG